MSAQCADSVAREVRARFEAMGAADVDTLERLFHSDLLYVHASGAQEEGSAILEKVRSGAVSYGDITLEIDEVRVVDHTAVVLGRFRATLTTVQGSRAIGSQFADVWVESAAAWRLVTYHAAPLPD